MLPMTGCDVSPSTVTRQQDRLSFRITHMNRVYHIHCYCESDHAEWVAAVSFISELSNNKILERIFLHKKVIKYDFCVRIIDNYLNNLSNTKLILKQRIANAQIQGKLNCCSLN